MTNPKLDTMRADIESEIKQVEDQLSGLRGQRDVINESIRLKVDEQRELRSALARLTSRRGKRTVEETPEEVSVA
jgi:hypothetical protein